MNDGRARMIESSIAVPIDGRVVRHVACAAALFLVLLLASGVEWDSRPNSATPARVRQNELIFAGRDLGEGTSVGVMSTSKGLTDVGVYTSPPISAPLPFTDVGPQWIVEVPTGASYTIEVRTGLDGETWEEWIAVEGELDWMRPETLEIVGELVPVPQSVRLHNTVQYRVHLEAAPDGQTPLLRQLKLSFIDGGVTSTAHTVLAADSFPKPSTVSRTAWGCPEGESSPRWPPEYEAVTHIIIHHTVTPNDDTDYAARVRAIWDYHANVRGWGDIGYNYLVARDGTLFVGRAGGDDVVGGHAYPGNYGSLGLAFMGTFVDDPVPSAMLAGATELMTWQVDQKDIDPLGWGWLYSSDPDNAADRWIHNISGHRDVWYTSCPGDVLYGHMPTLRDEIALTLEELRTTYVDDLDPEMVRFGEDFWWVGPDGCGYDDHAYWTFSVTDPSRSTNAAEWRPTLPVSGPYRVYAYVPYCINGYPDSGGVYYEIHHDGGTAAIAVSQASATGTWADLGVFNFDAGTSGYVRLADVADDLNRTVWFDAIKWYWEGDGDEGALPPSNLYPPDTSWSTDHSVTFRWSASPTAGVTGYKILLATDADLTSLIKIPPAVADYAEDDWLYDFGQDFRQIYWGVVAVGLDGDSPPSTAWRLGVDTVAPSASISGVYLFPDGHYSVTWEGEDATSGVASFDVEYREAEDAEWTRWLTQTPLGVSPLPFSPSETVWFRCRATDRAGNQGSFDDGGKNTADAILLDNQSFLPGILR